MSSAIVTPRVFAIFVPLVRSLASLANMTPAEAATCARLGAAFERVSADDVLANNDPARLAFAIIH
jgi:hypothetical protein